MSDDNARLQQLIASSKKLTEANIRKCETERILKEVTILKNFSNIFNQNNTTSSSDTNRNILLEKIFKISVAVVPGILRYGEESYNEIAIISIENKSKNLCFNPSYWQFVIDIGNGKHTSSWSLENVLEPGKVEKFSTNFTTSRDFTPLELKIRLVFSINFQNHHFVKTFNISRLVIDMLYLLSPGRCSSKIMFDNTMNSSHQGSFFSNEFTKSTMSSTHDQHLPSVTQFFFTFDSEMMKFFMEKLLLQDSLERGFQNQKDRLNDLVTFPVYYQEEEIIVTSKPACGTVSFKCANPRLLFAIKTAILTRLMKIERVKVMCPDDNVCEKLYSLKLRLEDMVRPTAGRGLNAEISDLMDIYLELRDVSETVQFLLLSDVE